MIGKDNFAKVKQLYRKRVIYIEDKLRIEYSNGKVYCIDNDTDRLLFQYSFEFAVIKKIISGISIVERLLRYEPRYAIRWSETEFLISCNGCLYKIDIALKKGERLFSYTKGTNNPLHFCVYIRNGVKEIVFGDYGGHDENGCVGIYRYSTNGLLEIAAFQKEQIDHVHRVEYDRYRDCYWIFTGDTDSASGIWHMGYSEEKATPFLVGNQKYRACVAFVDSDRILFATDSPYEKNYICSLNIADKTVDMICSIPGPCIYGTAVKNNVDDFIYCFSTSVEPDSSLPDFVYKFAYRLGAGVTDRYSYILAGNDKEGFHQIWKAKKDILPMWLFQFGNHRFPSQELRGRVYFCPQSCRKAKGTFVYNFL